MTQKISRRKLLKLGGISAAGLFILDSYWFERYVIDWNYFDISKSGKEKVKFIQISDLHMHELRSFHKSIARKINSIKPDLIFITGDSVEKTESIQVLEEFLDLLDYSIPKYAITGNWEYWGRVDLRKLKDAYINYNCELLINENRSVEIGNRRLSIIGIDDLVGGNSDFQKATANLVDSDTTIVLSHCPKHRDIISSQNGSEKIDLILSGHTHGGQLNFLGFVPFKPKGCGRYLKGWYKKSEPMLYVSKGVGTSILPMRFGARAEIVEMDV